MKSHIRVSQRAEGLGLGAQGVSEELAASYAPPQASVPIPASLARQERKKLKKLKKASEAAEARAPCPPAVLLQ